MQPGSDSAYLLWCSDLAPEASFWLSGDPQTSSKRRRGEIGLWLSQRPDELSFTAADNEPEVRTVTIEPIGGRAFCLTGLTGLTGLKALHPYLRRECLSVMPPPDDFSVISGVYFDKIDPIYPIIHEERLDALGAFEQTILKQCICLIAALDPSTRPHLRLGSSHTPLGQAEFREIVATAVKQALDAGFVRDKMTVLQATALMAFYTDKTKSSEISASYCAQAVILMQDMALDLGWPGDGNSTRRSRRIFFCIWTLDRLSAAVNGRSILLHDQDSDRRVWNALEEQLPAFRLLLGISKYLDSAIALYRPHADSKPQALGSVRSFEDFVSEAKAGDVGNSLLVSLELLYQSAVILHSRPPALQDDPNTDRLPSTTLQLYSASSIISLVSGDFKDSMSYWAVLPYAASLACSVAYKSFRNGTMSYRRTDAYGLFQRSCDALDEFSVSFASAQAMAKLAKITLQQVERVSANRGKGKSSEGHREDSQPKSLTAARPVDAEVQGAQPDTGEWAEPSLAIAPALGSGGTGVEQVPPATTVLDSSIFDDLEFTELQGNHCDLDLDFQLDRVDAAFSANLNPTMPLFPPDWLDDT